MRLMEFIDAHPGGRKLWICVSWIESIEDSVHDADVLTLCVATAGGGAQFKVRKVPLENIERAGQVFERFATAVFVKIRDRANKDNPRNVSLNARRIASISPLDQQGGLFRVRMAPGSLHTESLVIDEADRLKLVLRST